MGIQLTDSQRAVVENRGGSLLVSAAAGSGKTRVLVERLFARILGAEQANINDFLIITYTRAAAAELRERISEELRKRAAGLEDTRRIQRQMLLVYQTDIKTVDAFCTELLRENIQLLNLGEDRALTADFRVLDNNEAALLQRRTLPRVMEEFYQNMTFGKTFLADTFGFGRDDRGLEALVLELYRKVQSHTYPEQWLQQQKDLWENMPDDGGKTPFGEEMLTIIARKARHWANVLQKSRTEMAADRTLENAYAPGFTDAVQQLGALADAASVGWDAAAACVPRFPRLSAARKCSSLLKNRVKSRWDACKKEIADVCAVLDVSAWDAANDLQRSAPAMEALLDLTIAFFTAYRQEKLRRNVADFSDQEHYAVRLLLGEDQTPTELAKMVSNRYREVMVDEYQDTNQVQNCIFDAVSHGGENLFTVGDVKQSIYRFRLADPTIFLEKYHRYPDAASAGTGQPRRILLSQNFRSRKPVLDAVNFVFSAVMSREMGDIDYGTAEKLYFGADYLPPRTDCATELHVLDASERSVGDSDAPTPPAALLEARLVAARVAALLREGFPVTDTETNVLRPCCPEDIVILIRAPGPRLRHYMKALAEWGISCATQEDDAFFSAMETAILFAFLQILDNPHQDVPLLTVLHSPLGGFSPDRLAFIRSAAPEGDFYDALCTCGDADATDFLARLETLRATARDTSVYSLLWTLYGEWNVLGVFGAMADGERRKENLIALTEYARLFESAGYKGLFAFVSHLRFLLETGEQPKHGSGAGRGVRIMSIHRAKGLEFPIVVLADLNKRFNTLDLQAPVLVHPQLGLGPNFIDLDRRIRYPTVAHDAVSSRLGREGRSEEMRLLYVGMTRAKEKLILVASMSSPARRLRELTYVSGLPVPPETVDSARSMAEWVLLPVLQRPEAAPLRRFANVDVDLDVDLDVNRDMDRDLDRDLDRDMDADRCATERDSPWQIVLHSGKVYTCPPRAGADASVTDTDSVEPLQFDPEVLRFTYPHQAACSTPTKLTATQLKGRILDREIAEDTLQPYAHPDFPAPRFLSGEIPVSAAAHGTAMHLVMQYLPLDGDVDAIVLDLIRRRLLTEEQAENLNRFALRRFLDSPLADELRQADRLEREYRFSILVPAGNYYSDMAAEDRLLLQGVVDLFAVKDNTLTVVDFKTDYVTAETQAARAEYYRPQLAAYSAALEKIWDLPVRRRVIYFFHSGEAVEV